MGPCQDTRDSEGVKINRGVGGAVSGDDDIIVKTYSEIGGDDGTGWMGKVICIYPYVPLTSYQKKKQDMLRIAPTNVSSTLALKVHDFYSKCA